MGQSEARSSGCSSRGLGLSPQHPQGGSQVPGIRLPLLRTPGLYVEHTHKCRQSSRSQQTSKQTNMQSLLSLVLCWHSLSWELVYTAGLLVAPQDFAASSCIRTTDYFCLMQVSDTGQCPGWSVLALGPLSHCVYTHTTCPWGTGASSVVCLIL